MEESIFQPYISSRPSSRWTGTSCALRSSRTVSTQEEQVDQLAQILATALRGTGRATSYLRKTGTGKTAVVKYIENELKKLDGGRAFSTCT